MAEHMRAVSDTDKRFIIDPKGRKIVPSDGKGVVIVKGDSNSEIITFEIPRFVEGHDMMLSDAVRVNYNNISKDTKNENRDFRDVKDLHVDFADGDKVVFTWKIDENATVYHGSLLYMVTFRCLDAENNITYEWGSGIGSDIVVSDGINNDIDITQKYPEIIKQWEADLKEEMRQYAEKEVEKKVSAIQNNITEAENNANSAAAGAVSAANAANAAAEACENIAAGINAVSDDAVNGVTYKIGVSGGQMYLEEV